MLFEWIILRWRWGVFAGAEGGADIGWMRGSSVPLQPMRNDSCGDMFDCFNGGAIYSIRVNGYDASRCDKDDAKWIERDLVLRSLE